MIDAPCFRPEYPSNFDDPPFDQDPWGAQLLKIVDEADELTLRRRVDLIDDIYYRSCEQRVRETFDATPSSSRAGRWSRGRRAG
jgi:hypothetical protein